MDHFALLMTHEQLVNIELHIGLW